MKRSKHAKTATAMKARKGHIIIAGTGRAGTSFLVSYLAELGMETYLSSHETLLWDEHAHAGLEEDRALLATSQTLPHVIKSPWMYEYIEQLLAREDFKIDCAIVPIRDLVKVAASRSILEMRARYQNAPWLTQFDETWETWGITPGGIHFSLNPLDQARILAVGFHHLVERLTAANVPIIFMTFPHFVENWEYLYHKLKSYLPAGTNAEEARGAHNRVADVEKIRVEKDLLTDAAATTPSKIVRPEMGRADLDRISLRRELERLHRENSKLATLSEHRAVESHGLVAQRDALAQAHNNLIAERDALAQAHNNLIAERNALLASRSWRLTAPLRKMRRLFARQP